jgi:hypothetical protein
METHPRGKGSNYQVEHINPKLKIRLMGHGRVDGTLGRV